MMGKPPEKPVKWPAEEDHFHEPYVQSEAVDSSLTIAINHRNEIRAGDDSRREPPKTHALQGLFSDD